MAKGSKQRIEKTESVPVAAKPAWMRIFVWSVVGCAALLGLYAIGMTLGRNDDISRFATQGWGAYAGAIVDNKIRALWHAVFMTSCAAGFLWLFLLAKPKKTIIYEWAKWGLVLLVAVDAWMLSRHYVKTMPLSAMDENAVVSLLKKDMPVQRVALVSQEGFYNWWLTFLFPYHNIQTVNITQMPRMPDDYKNFLSAVGRNPVRFWQMAAVGYVLAPKSVWDQLQKEPALRDTFELQYSYNVEPGPENAGVTVIPATPSMAAQHVVLRFRKPGPRFALFAGAETCADQEALSRLADPKTPLFRKVLLAPECATHVPALTGTGIVGKVEPLEYRPGRFHLKTSCLQPALLRVSEKFDNDWKAVVDGAPAPVLRVDYIFQGVFLPAGDHEVVLKYAPAIWPLYIQLSGMAVCLGAALWLAGGALLRRLRRTEVDLGSGGQASP